MGWLLDRAGHGDILVLRASGDDGYNAYLKALRPINSVETVVCHAREASADPALLDKVAKAEGIFLAGGNQARYRELWEGTPLQEAVQTRLDAGVPVGGTSAGLAVLGQPMFTADHGSVDSPEALANPAGERMALAPGWLHVGALDGIVTDTHFSERDRMGRLLAFSEQAGARGLGVDERTALLLEPDGRGRVVGQGDVYLVTPAAGGVCQSGMPLSSHADVARWHPGDSVDLRAPQGEALGLVAGEGQLTWVGSR